MWFETLMGFAETDRATVMRSLSVRDGLLSSRVNGRSYRFGVLGTPSLGSLRARGQRVHAAGHRSTLREQVGNVQDLHLARPGALFQAASQFNLLEMTSPRVTPDEGVSIYAHDRTQGPACAIACGAGTIYRNYFVDLDGQQGQTATRQIDCLADLGAALGNADGHIWQMQNGYAMCSAEGLRELAGLLSAASTRDRDALRQTLRIGLHRDVEVTLPGGGHTVTQVYGSALPVAYGGPASQLWEPLARLVLEASYEATLWAAVLQAERTGNRQVFLTLLGGGVFGNDLAWILDAIARAMKQVDAYDLDVAIVSYEQSKRSVRRFVAAHGCA